MDNQTNLQRFLTMLAILVSSVTTANAEIIGFESYQPTIGSNAHSYFGTPGNLEGSLNIGVLPMGFLGYSISSRTAFQAGNSPDPNNYFANGDDTISAPKVGASGSQTWLTTYNFFKGDTVFQVDPSKRIRSFSITNTLLNAYSFKNGLGKFSKPFTDPTDFFDVKFFSIDNSGNSIAETNWISLAKGGVVPTVLETWQVIDIQGLDAFRIAFEFRSSDNDPDFGMNTPAYLSFDNFEVANLAAVPEPSSALLIGLSGACGLGYRSWKRRRFLAIGG